jgi:hypothetical protein
VNTFRLIRSQLSEVTTGHAGGIKKISDIMVHSTYYVDKDENPISNTKRPSF